MIDGSRRGAELIVDVDRIDAAEARQRRLSAPVTHERRGRVANAFVVLVHRDAEQERPLHVERQRSELIGQIDDVSRAVTMDLKQAGNSVYLLGETRGEIGGSYADRIVQFGQNWLVYAQEKGGRARMASAVCRLQ